jgi:arginyl-tRNA synthetase
MLAMQGNTAPYLLYVYARIAGIGRKGGIDLSDFLSVANTVFILTEPTEFVLAKHLLGLEDVINTVATELLPNRLCQYLFELSQKFNQFYDQCSILQAEEPLRMSRLQLCHLTAKTLGQGLSLLGITVLKRM